MLLAHCETAEIIKTEQFLKIGGGFVMFLMSDFQTSKWVVTKLFLAINENYLGSTSA